MSPEQALALLNQVSAQIPASREVHMQIVKAVEVLKEAIKGK